SLAFGKVFRVPSQVFSVPGIVAMLPGMLALSSFRYFASGDQDTGLEFTFQVAVTAVSIVFGLISARIPFSISEKIRHR
ncbi:MAG: threonine/serine exporter family protein, partial [Bdellovibrionota bacterium]